MKINPKIRAKLEDVRHKVERSPAYKALVKHWALVAIALWATVVALVTQAELSEFVDANVTRPFYFRARERLKMDPDLHPKLKILSYDDGSVDKLQRPDLTIDDWSTVLTALGRQKPRMILIDKVFSVIFDPLGRKDEAIAALKAMDVPVVVGAYASEDKKKTKVALDLSRPQYQTNGKVTLARNPYDKWFIYGPNPLLAEAFHGAGSILYQENGVVGAFLFTGGDKFVPHISLYTAGERKFVDGRLIVDGIDLPISKQGQIIVNFPREAKFYDRHQRLGTAVLSARDGKPIKGIEAGDTVLILPEMFSGSTDFKFTPLGLIPGGFILGSMINSVLTHTWLTPLPGKVLLVLLFCVLGALLGRRFQSMKYWGGQVLVTTLALAACVYLFAYHSVVVSALMPMIGFWGSSFLAFAEKTREREKEADRLRDEVNDAAEIAKAFRPDGTPQWGRFSISSFHRSFTEASGDWYAFRTSPSGRYHHFIMCDITGHGVQAAMVVSICKTMLVLSGRSMLTTLSDADAHKLEDRDFLQKYAQELSSMLFYHGKGQHLVTMLGFTFDNEANELIYISAGHPSPILFATNPKTGDRKFSLMSLRSTVLGLENAPTFKPLVTKLKDGDEIIAYTDGLPINRHVRAATAFFKEHSYDIPGAPKALLDCIWNSEFAKSGKWYDDDVSIVWFKASLPEVAADAPVPVVAADGSEATLPAAQAEGAESSGTESSSASERTA